MTAVQAYVIQVTALEVLVPQPVTLFGHALLGCRLLLLNLAARPLPKLELVLIQIIVVQMKENQTSQERLLVLRAQKAGLVLMENVFLVLIRLRAKASTTAVLIVTRPVGLEVVHQTLLGAMALLWCIVAVLVVGQIVGAGDRHIVIQGVEQSVRVERLIIVLINVWNIQNITMVVVILISVNVIILLKTVV